MVLLNTDIFKWRTLTGLQNRIKPNNVYLQQLLFGTDRTYAGNLVETSIRTGNARMAPFVKQGSAAQLIKGLGSSVEQYTFPTIRLKMPFDAPKYLAEVAPGMSGAIELGGEESQMLSSAEQMIADDMEEFDRYISNTIEWMCGRAMTGSITYSKAVADPGLDTEEIDHFTINFGRAGANTITLDTNTSWAATPNNDPAIAIRSGKQVLNSAVGQTATHMLCGRTAGASFVGNTAVTANLDIRRLNQAGPIELGGGQMLEGATFEGTYAGVEVWTYDRKVDIVGPDLSVVAAAADILDADSAYLFSVPNASSNQRIEYGGIQDWEAMKAGTLKAKRFAKAYTVDDPSAAFQLVETRPLPFLLQPDAIVEIKAVSTP
jgi:hypothetical protein